MAIVGHFPEGQAEYNYKEDYGIFVPSSEQHAACGHVVGAVVPEVEVACDQVRQTSSSDIFSL